MEHVITLRAEITAQYENTGEDFLNSDSIEEFKKRAVPFFEGWAKGNNRFIHDIKVSDVKVFQLE